MSRQSNIHVNFVFRKRGKGASIEELYSDLINSLRNHGVEAFKIEVPNSKIQTFGLLRNILFVSKINGIIHITGDINYTAINPFKKIILTVHDTGSILKGNKIEKLVKKILWFWLPSIFVSKFIVVSEFTKSELKKIVPWSINKICVVHNPVNSALIKVFKKFNKKYPCILHIGTNENKNLENTISALKGISCNLIVIGHLSKSQIAFLNQSKIAYKNFEGIQYFKVKELYEKCDIVSFISKYEGFGMPIIEAQKVGRVVITSNCAAIPEVAGQGAHFVNPNSINSINDGFKKIISDEEYRDKIIEAGFINVKQFELNNITKKYFQIYNDMSK